MRLKLDARARRILRRMPVVNVYSLAELALMGVLAVQCARFVWVLTTPVTPLGAWRPAAPVVAGADILGSFDPFFRLGGGAAAPATVTALQLTLFGTRIDEAMGGGSAIIAGPDGVQQSVAVGAEIQPGVRLKSVAFDHVTIERGGADEDLFLDQSGAVTPVIPGAAPGAAPASPAAGIPVAQLRQEIGFIPRIDDGRISGLTVRAQGSGAAFRAAGLKDGDVVTSLGGRPVSGPGDLDRIAKDFAGGGNVPITVERGQDTLQLAITIAPSMKTAQ
ncbi:PDZ domain-containing protein [Sphingomonas ginsenosidivorax]|uniref:PDZ domain-containing protein n=1 Tax=Sphingomonas ginsenosidivorax TaxID=862135 RepID=A0A5C6UBE1_9SPHN|nr:type II secretion system protein N [Sphingomonas ginsenosidivorax]TXC70123.1 PDZ domain-containing protein [Sphingomonas ginsenosidivorax]